MPKRAAAAEELVAVRIEDAELCPRYTARVVRGVKIGPSPDWLRSTLEKVGIRSISNVVDVTNYVMLETGQPLHAFDYHLLAKAGRTARLPTIVVRRAGDGEKFMTLDGQERTLTSQMLLIADETKAVALAGVMGGQNSEINLNTVDVLIESACFKPQNIRATSKKLELRTESSYRFERGRGHRHLRLGEPARGAVDPGNRRRHAGRGRRGRLPEAFRRQSKSPCATPQTDAVLGIAVPMEQQIEYPATARPGDRHGCRALLPSTGVRMPHTTVFRVPSFRVDLKREIDLIEEVARLYGVDKIPATPRAGPSARTPTTPCTTNSPKRAAS